MLAAALITLGLLASFAVLFSEMPRFGAWPVAMAAALYGTWLGWREWHSPLRDLLVPLDEAPFELNGEPLVDLAVHWRGAVAFLVCRRGRTWPHRTSLWPDVLDAAAQRELRLAMAARAPSRSRRSVAP